MRWKAVLAGAVLLATALPMLPTGSSVMPEAAPLVVVAHIDVGINPYSLEFRWNDPRALQHPCTYIPQYPCSAIAVPITLDEPDWDTAFAKDQALWLGLQLRTLYWFPGTKVIGAISYNDHGNIVILDEDGHGTMTASRSAGNTHSLCEECLFVAIEGLGPEGVSFAANSGFVDVQTNSWASGQWISLNHPYPAILFEASKKHIVLFASGNGFGGFDGYVSNPTYTMPTGAPGVILVGAHDNGRVLTWPGSPPQVIADGYGGWTALRDSVSEVRPDPGACCTSAASPYAAGGAAAIVMEARRILGDPGPGIRNGIVAQGPPDLVPQGPLKDGVFTLDEFRQVFFHTATLRPVEGPDDGLLHWMAQPGVDNLPPFVCDPEENLLAIDTCVTGWIDSWGQNPFCPGCWSTPLEYRSVPGTFSWWDREGYGAIDRVSVGVAQGLLEGRIEMPDRPLEDALYKADQTLRNLWWFRQLPSG